MTHKLDGRVAIVTGAGRGIGEAVALTYAAEGARLAIASRTATELEEVAARCRAAGSECLALVTDVSSATSVRHLVDTTLKHFGRIDILANIAGVYGPIGPIEDVDLDGWAEALNINLLGTLYTCQAVLPTMRAQHYGRIVAMSGGGAASPLPRFSAYGVSKAAVVRFVETLAEEVKDDGITVNAIAPGAIDTTLQDAVIKAGERAGDLFRRIKALRESGAGGTPIDVPVELALFLATEQVSGLTGRLISAPNDDWRSWDAERIDALTGTPWFTLRRIDPFTIRPLANSQP